ncbi:hypothetical protein [Hyalangium rubrum]|uniref:Uncharacterized protein n=1 Tax=Hyalangium rubrum TaxID=3103134 RepID=A0ABU5H186_9BACT|nr:hypothetical protein [Hyalangium sp. s54d21]MDY7226527.1 hypothetical protein [Hyalangium sp. s54d21]
MAQDLNTLLKALQELTSAAKEPGRLTPQQLEAEVKKITGALQETLASLSTQLGPGASAQSALLVDAFKAQLVTMLQQSGVTIEKTDEMKKLGEELEKLKRGFIRS